MNLQELTPLNPNIYWKYPILMAKLGGLLDIPAKLDLIKLLFKLRLEPDKICITIFRPSFLLIKILLGDTPIQVMLLLFISWTMIS